MRCPRCDSTFFGNSWHTVMGAICSVCGLKGHFVHRTTIEFVPDQPLKEYGPDGWSGQGWCNGGLPSSFSNMATTSSLPVQSIKNWSEFVKNLGVGYPFKRNSWGDWWGSKPTWLDNPPNFEEGTLKFRLYTDFGGYSYNPKSFLKYGECESYSYTKPIDPKIYTIWGRLPAPKFCYHVMHMTMNELLDLMDKCDHIVQDQKYEVTAIQRFEEEGGPPKKQEGPNEGSPPEPHETTSERVWGQVVKRSGIPFRIVAGEPPREG